jgi:hypothetical protein
MLDVITRRQPTVRAPIFGRVRCGPPNQHHRVGKVARGK